MPQEENMLGLQGSFKAVVAYKTVVATCMFVEHDLKNRARQNYKRSIICNLRMLNM